MTATRQHQRGVNENPCSAVPEQHVSILWESCVDTDSLEECTKQHLADKPSSGTTENSSTPLHLARRELISLIQKYSTKKTEDKSAVAWSFPTANEQEAAHKEWTVKDILAHIGT
jgi:hypothetical protein